MAGAVFSTGDELGILASGGTGGRALDALVVVACGGAVALAAWRTTAAAVLLWVTLPLALASGDLGGAIVALVVVSALVAATADRAFLGLHLGVSVAWLVAVAVARPETASALAWLVVPLLLTAVGLGAAIHTFTGQRRAAARRIEALEAEATRVREEERRALARDLHDVVAHELTVITLLVNGHRGSREEEDLRGALDTIGDTSRRALVELRRLLHLMREVAPLPDGQDRVTQDSSARVLAGLGGNLTGVGVATTVDVAPGFDEVSPVVRETCVRVVQEACTNVIKHAGPGSVCTVTVEVHDVVLARVHNSVPGAGPVPAAFPRSGFGLSGARERLDLIGGELSSGPVGGGWLVQARMPLVPPDRF